MPQHLPSTLGRGSQPREKYQAAAAHDLNYYSYYSRVRSWPQRLWPSHCLIPWVRTAQGSPPQLGSGTRWRKSRGKGFGQRRQGQRKRKTNVSLEERTKRKSPFIDFLDEPLENTGAWKDERVKHVQEARQVSRRRTSIRWSLKRDTGPPSRINICCCFNPNKRQHWRGRGAPEPTSQRRTDLQPEGHQPSHSTGLDLLEDFRF